MISVFCVHPKHTKVCWGPCWQKQGELLSWLMYPKLCVSHLCDTCVPIPTQLSLLSGLLPLPGAEFGHYPSRLLLKELSDRFSFWSLLIHGAAHRGFGALGSPVPPG